LLSNGIICVFARVGSPEFSPDCFVVLTSIMFVELCLHLLKNVLLDVHSRARVIAVNTIDSIDSTRNRPSFSNTS